MTRDSGTGTFDIAIIGGGPVGLLTALLLADRLPAEARIRLIAGRRSPPEDGRAAALIGRSMAILDSVGVGDAFRADGASMAALRMIDVTGRLLRAPTATFRASEAGLDVFGVSLFTARIVALLRERVGANGRIELLPVDAANVERSGGGWRITDDEGRALEADLIVASDGQRSLAREAAGISVRRWSYPQTALTFAVRHDLDHEDISTEFHTPDGPFTLVPGGDRLSTVVWMTNPGEAERLMALDDASFARAAEKVCRSILGRLTLAGARGAYPMGGLLAERFARARIALVGETGHAFPRSARRDEPWLPRRRHAGGRAGEGFTAGDPRRGSRPGTGDGGATRGAPDRRRRRLQPIAADRFPARRGGARAGDRGPQGDPPLRRAVMRAGLAG